MEREKKVTSICEKIMLNQYLAQKGDGLILPDNFYRGKNNSVKIIPKKLNFTRINFVRTKDKIYRIFNLAFKMI
jgi:hypothetical protein